MAVPVGPATSDEGAWPAGPRKIVLTQAGALVRGEAPDLSDRFRSLLEGWRGALVVCDVSAVTAPDAVVVDALARLKLTARRLDIPIRLDHACGALRDLLSLMGLDGVLPLCRELPVEPRGQPEQREQPRGIEEEADAADPPV